MSEIRYKNPYCLDPTETSCPRLAKLGMKWNPATGALVQSEQELPKTDDETKSLVEKVNAANWEGYSTIDNKILPQKPNVTALNQKQVDSAKLCRASKIYYKEGYEKAQEYLGEKYTILPEYSGKFHITVINTETGEYEIAGRGIEFGNPEDILDLAQMTLNPKSAQSYKDIVETINDLEIEPDILHGYSRGGKVMINIGHETGIDVIAHNPALGTNELELTEPRNNVEIVRMAGDFASSLTGLFHPDHWKTSVVEAGSSEGSVEQHFLHNLLNKPVTDVDVYGRPLRAEIDIPESMSGVAGLAGLGGGIADITYKSMGKKDPEALVYTNAVVGESTLAYSAPEMFQAESGASDIEYLMERTGFTESLKSRTRKEEETRMAFDKGLAEQNNRQGEVVQPSQPVPEYTKSHPTPFFARKSFWTGG